MQPPPGVEVRVRLIAGVDDGPAHSGLQAHGLFEEVGALRDLESGLLCQLADAHPAGPAEDLPGGEERQQVGDQLVEGHAARYQVVLMGAVGDGFVVRVVLIQQHLWGVRLLVESACGSPGDGVAGHVEEHRTFGADRLRRRVFGVGVIHIEAGTVAQHQVHQQLRLVLIEPVEVPAPVGGSGGVGSPALSSVGRAGVAAGDIAQGVAHATGACLLLGGVAQRLITVGELAGVGG